MATLQKFKFLATQCVVIGSPTRSPTTSPVVHLRRRKTLRMLLGRAGNNHHRRFHRRDGSPDPPRAEERTSAEFDNEEEEEHRRRQQHHRHQISVRHKLKDLFVSSPPPLADVAKKMDVEDAQGLVPAAERVGSCGAAISGGGGGGATLVVAGRIGAGAMRPLSATLRPLSATLRQRLLRRAWRPVLVAIPEQSP